MIGHWQEPRSSGTRLKIASRRDLEVYAPMTESLGGLTCGN